MIGYYRTIDMLTIVHDLDDNRERTKQCVSISLRFQAQLKNRS